jgi:hypothetical protein
LAAAKVDGSWSVAGVKSEVRLNNSVAIAFGVVVVVSGSDTSLPQFGSANSLGGDPKYLQEILKGGLSCRHSW